MGELTVDHFNDYFEAVHGCRPFPWQDRLLRTVDESGRWPVLLDLPTGAGKTAAIDVAVFHLALDVARSPVERRAPRRILMVVDRRTIVDQAHERATIVASAIRDASTGVLGEIRARLSSIGDADEPLGVVQLRGGMPRDDSWARRPDQPLVAVSTVDQVGSRLLFRGYGVSDVMRPIHAGLLGNDALLLLDEVHLSQPFLETMEALTRYRAWSDDASPGLPDRWQFVPMSATARSTEHGFGLTEEDRGDERLARRLAAKKPSETKVVKVSGGDDARREMFAAEVARLAVSAATPGRAVGVVVNRVATALAVAEAVKREVPDTVLVTGRMRPIDRDARSQDLARRVASGRKREAHTAPLVVVATQCIEAGADYDFDELVSECASLDALRQRFGRLNRIGAIDDARGTVVIRSDNIGNDKPDPIYGAALAKTWEWLASSSRDFGVDAIAPQLPSGAALEAMLPPRTRAPIMLPAHLDAWVQTAPPPRPDPDVALWLHGVDQQPELDVHLVWRSDINEEDLNGARSDEAKLDALVGRVEVCAPTGPEALAVPIGAVRAWLGRRKIDEIADVERRTGRDPDDDEAASGLLALAWNHDASRIVEPREIRPAMTLIIPSAYGGLSTGNWDPRAREPVEDLGHRARWLQTGRTSLRLHALLPEVAHLAEKLPTWGVDDESGADDRAAVEDWLVGARDRAEDPWLKAALEKLKWPAIVRLAEGEMRYFGVIGRRSRGARGADFTTEGEAGSHVGVEVTLDSHLQGVAEFAASFAKSCGLPAAVAGDIELAGRWHDAGKVDPRFQRLLCGGSLLAEVADEPLAKSRILEGDRASRARARKRSGYPEGARHELGSVALLEQASALLATAHDRDLVLHLVSSHHGWCRPFAPVSDDREPVDLILKTAQGEFRVASNHSLASLDSGIAERFWRLVKRYGWFGLAWLEAVLRLADHRRSEHEQAPSTEETT